MLLRRLRKYVVLIPILVLIPQDISMYMSNLRLSWLKSRTKYTWILLHPLTIESTSAIIMVNQVMTGENVSKKFEVYYFFLPRKFRHALCLNTHLVLMSILCLNDHADARTCYTFGNCYPEISSQWFCSMWALTSLIISFWKSLALRAFMAWR